MRYILIHKTIPRWEAGEKPSPETIAKVGALIGELVKTKKFLGGEGLRPSSEGVRIDRAGGTTTTRRGPFAGETELPGGITMLKAATTEEAVEWAKREAEAIEGNVQIDVRPLTEAWDIGMGERPVPAPPRRFMALRKATAASEAGQPAPAALARVHDDAKRAGALLGKIALAPSKRGRRYLNAKDGVRVIDGPFAETKELIAGYCLIEAPSLDAAAEWVPR